MQFRIENLEKIKRAEIWTLASCDIGAVLQLIELANQLVACVKTFLHQLPLRKIRRRGVCTQANQLGAGH